MNRDSFARFTLVYVVREIDEEASLTCISSDVLVSKVLVGTGTLDS